MGCPPKYSMDTSNSATAATAAMKSKMRLSNFNMIAAV
jgi:hypothetical protein